MIKLNKVEQFLPQHTLPRTPISLMTLLPVFMNVINPVPVKVTSVFNDFNSIYQLVRDLDLFRSFI